MGRTYRVLPLLLGLSTLMAGVLTPAAEAKRGPCIPGQKKPTCQIWKAKVFTTADGDTFNAKIWEGGRWTPRKDIRLLGVQAMELTDYSRAHGREGDCHAVAAAERFEELLQGPSVKRRRSVWPRSGRAARPPARAGGSGAGSRTSRAVAGTTPRQR